MLNEFINDFCAALKAADAKWPQASNHAGTRVYKPGIGPHSEDCAVRLILAELMRANSAKYPLLRTNEPYPESKQRCDIVFGSVEKWLVEVKMARFSGDNGKPDDTSVKDILSPFENDRSAISDCIKLSESKFQGKKAILIYGFNDKRRPIDRIISAFETLAKSYVRLGVRLEASFEGLVHPVFESGRVYGWEVNP